MVWNPTLLAALASPNVPDYAGRISQMDLNSAQREKMLAELAYLPQQQQNEALKNQAYLLQQGYMIDPATGRPVMTPAKAAQVQAQQALLQSLGLNNDNPMFPPTSGVPSLPIGDRTQSFVPPDASANMYNYGQGQQGTDLNPAPANAPVMPQLQLAAGVNGNTQNSFIPRLNDMIDSGQASVPATIQPQIQSQQQTQTQPQQQIKLPYSQDMISLAGIADFGIKPTDMIAANKNVLDQQKMLQDQIQNSPEFKQRGTEATKTGENIAEADKTLNLMQSNLPAVLTRFEVMRTAANQASYGSGANNEGTGVLQEYHKNFNKSKTGDANAVLAQAASQGVLPELGPQLAQAGIRGNKFLEQLASQASGLDLAASPSAKLKAIDGLERTYISNLKSTSAQLRRNGKDAPTNQQIDAYVTSLKQAPQQNGSQNTNNSIPEGSTATNPQTGHKIVFKEGKWQDSQ